MTQFSTITNKVPGLRFMADALDIRSTPGRHRLLKFRMMTRAEDIEHELEKVNLYRNFFTKLPKEKETLKYILTDVHDITGTIGALKTDIVLDDIGLFEIKKFALNIQKIKDLLTTCSDILPAMQKEAGQINDMQEVIALLDPENQRIPHFYIYDAYDGNLAQLRKKYREVSHGNTEGKETEGLRLNCEEIEDTVRQQLTRSLSQNKEALQANLAIAGDIDVWLAKAELAVGLNLTRPITQTVTELKLEGLFNPAISDALKQRGKSWQPVDVELTEGPTLITGANMGGKTVLLKTVALCQHLYQFGFFVPAATALMKPYEKILFSTGDEQSELKGLSSFASEMLKINGIITSTAKGEKVLALIDEPARTTNPVEGLALVKALIQHLSKYKATSLVTTHYTIDNAGCRRLRVKGLTTGQMPSRPSIEAIQDYMDYSLAEVQENDEVPQEALRIAEILEVDEDYLKLAKEHLKAIKK
jgi:dsDNA-specific endonuclease/ATPase MutS2